MKRYFILSAILSVVLVLSASFAATSTTRLATQSGNRESNESGSQAQLARQAKITMEQARATALNRAPGNVESGELEREHGRLVYSFDIRNSRGTITEVQVSAINGKVVRVEHENRRHEAAERQQESRERTGRRRH